VLIGGALLLAAASVHAAKKPKTVDTFWTYPDYQKIKVERIAVIPAASYDNNIQTETTVEQALGMQLKGQKYRWVSASTTRDLLRSMTGSDSLLKAVKAQILKEPRVDSLTAQRLCSMIHCDALLSTRVDLWEQQTIEWNQSGKPSTTVQLKAALVDAQGRLLWTAAGSQSSEGPYYDANSATIGVKDSGLERKPVTGQGGPPTYLETLTTLLTRWAPNFPAPPEKPPGSTGTEAPPDSGAGK
jgi:hypothetical protein